MPGVAKTELDDRVRRNYRLKYGRWWKPHALDEAGKIVIPRPDYLIERECYMNLGGVREGTSKVCEVVGDRLTDDPEQEVQGQAEHFRRYASAILAHPKVARPFLWTPNAIRITDKYFEHDYLAVAGHGGCVSADTKLLNPLTGEEHEIKWLCDNNIAPVVMTLDGPTQAEVPYLKGEEVLMEFVFSNGHSIKCTPNHRFLTPSGFVHASDVSLQDELFGYEPCLPPTISDTCQPAHAQGAADSQRTVGDSQAGCHPSHRCDDELLPLARAACQSSPPSPTGAQTHTRYACGNEDGPASSQAHIHLGPQSSLPSTPDCSDHAHQFETVPSTAHAEEQTCSLFVASSQSSWQSLSGSRPHQTASGPTRNSSHTQGLYTGSSSMKITVVRVVSITVLGKKPYYDIGVPGPQHYFAHGTIHHNSGKSECVAVIALCEFLASPQHTKIIVSSTTLKEARGRIWGRIEHYWQEAEEFFRLHAIPGLPQGIPMPGDLVSSQGFIRLSLGGRKDDTRGITLAPGKESEIKEGVGRMKGFHAPRVRFYPDELSDLSHKLIEAADTNLSINPNFKMVGTFNPSSHFDPAGVFSEPKNGWDSINVLESDGWETHRGYCIRFDGEQSPNVVAGYEKYPGLLTKERLDQKREELGSNSPRFMEQFRGAWSTTGLADAIYTEAEIIQYLGMKKPDVWVSQPIRAAGFDPSWVHGGDRAVAVIVQTGLAISQAKQVPVTEVLEVVYLDEDLDTTRDKKELVIQRLKQAMTKYKVDPKNLAMDASGGGDPFATLMAQDPYFGTSFIRVQFGGQASEMQAPGAGGKKGKDRFYNMASELWYAGKAYLRCGQLRGLTPGLVREMTLRLYTETGKPPKIKIEAKENMKDRLQGRSPDAADAFFLALFGCRVRLKFTCAERVATTTPTPQPAGHPMANLIAWGQKKQQTLTDPMPVDTTMGSGWDQDSAGKATTFSGMFGSS